jgi:hypothetical protein
MIGESPVVLPGTPDIPDTPSPAGTPGGIPSGPSPTNPGASSDCGSAAISLGDSRLLTKQELLNTLGAAFAPIPLGARQAVASVPSESVETGYPNNVGASIAGEFHLSTLITVAEVVADKVSAEFQQLGLVCASDTQCVETLVKKTGTIAFRRSLTDWEISRFATAANQGMNRQEKLRFAVLAMVLSPEFLYELHRPNIAEPAAKKAAARTEIAARLSYMLWEGPPNSELLAAAESGQLDAPSGRKEFALKMMTDERFQRRFFGFVKDWLQLEIGEWEKDPSFQLDANFREEALAEIARFTSSIVQRNGSFEDLMTDSSGFVTPQLAKIYGTDIAPGTPVQAGTMTAVKLNAERRGGILTRIGFLAANSHSLSPSAPLMGKTLSNRVLCETIPDPPAAVQDMFPSLPNDPSKSMRDLLINTTSATACSGCHNAINPLGLSFGNYGTTGNFQLKDKHGFDVDSSAMSPTLGAIANGVDMSRKAAANPAAQKCFLENVFLFASARTTTTHDACLVDGLKTPFVQSNLSVKQAFASIAERLVDS